MSYLGEALDECVCSHWIQIFGKNDNHVPPEGRDLIRKTLHEKGVLFGFYEAAWAQREFDTWG